MDFISDSNVSPNSTDSGSSLGRSNTLIFYIPTSFLIFTSIFDWIQIFGFSGIQTQIVGVGQGADHLTTATTFSFFLDPICIHLRLVDVSAYI